MEKFNKIIKDPIIQRTYSEIENFEDETGGIAYHNFNHVMNVALSVESLLTDLACDKIFIEEAMIAAILHDLGSLDGKEGHTVRSFNFAKHYLKENGIKLVYENLVLDAIITHSNGFESDNLMALALIISDKLDIKSTRISKAGLNVHGLRQLKHMNDITLEIKEGILEVNFLSDEAMNQAELEQFYFMDKVFKSIRAFADKVNLVPIVNLNEKPWDVFTKGGSNE